MEWSEVEPVLKATYRLLDRSDETTPETVCDELGVAVRDERTLRALALLYRDQYIGGRDIDEYAWPVRIESASKGLQLAAGWPSDGGDARHVELLLQLLDERIESDETPEAEKGRLRRARDAFAALGRDIGVAVLAAYAARLPGAVGGG